MYCSSVHFPKKVPITGAWLNKLHNRQWDEEVEEVDLWPFLLETGQWTWAYSTHSSCFDHDKGFWKTKSSPSPKSCILFDHWTDGETRTWPQADCRILSNMQTGVLGQKLYPQEYLGDRRHDVRSRMSSSRVEHQNHRQTQKQKVNLAEWQNRPLWKNGQQWWGWPAYHVNLGDQCQSKSRAICDQGWLGMGREQRRPAGDWWEGLMWAPVFQAAAYSWVSRSSHHKCHLSS